MGSRTIRSRGGAGGDSTARRPYENGKRFVQCERGGGVRRLGIIREKVSRECEGDPRRSVRQHNSNTTSAQQPHNSPATAASSQSAPSSIVSPGPATSTPPSGIWAWLTADGVLPSRRTVSRPSSRPASRPSSRPASRPASRGVSRPAALRFRCGLSLSCWREQKTDLTLVVGPLRAWGGARGGGINGSHTRLDGPAHRAGSGPRAPSN